MRKRNAITKAQQAGTARLRWMPGLFSLLLVLALAWSGILTTPEQWLYRQTLNYFAPTPNLKKVMVLTVPSAEATDQQELARALARLSRARAVGLLLPLQRRENVNALNLVQERLTTLKESPSTSSKGSVATLRGLVEELDSTEPLTTALRKSSNVILGVNYQYTRKSEKHDAISDSELGRVTPNSVLYLDVLPSIVAPALPVVSEGPHPVPDFITAARSVGLVGNGRVAFPAVLKGANGAAPSMLLQLLRLNHNAFSKDGLSFTAPGGILIGNVQFATDRAYRFYPFIPLNAGLEGLTQYPLASVAAGDYSLNHFRGNTVLIGAADDPNLAQQARAIGALLQKEQVSVPAWSLWAQYGALLLVTLLSMWLLPRMGYTAAAVTTLLLSLLLVNGEFLLLLLGKQWLPLLLPLLVLWFGYPLISFRRYLAVRHGRLAAELAVANRQLGRLLQSQGELEQALEKYRRCPVDDELLEQLYHLGLDFERKRQFNKAVSVFQHIDAISRDFRDVAERIKRNQSMEQRIVLAKGGGANTEATVIMSSEGLQNPTVGHYQIEREIGRGAMGMVYLGKDPRIGRQVAIKTMALSSEFEDSQLKEVKQRFYQEAETAGRLNHPNIVHVYDIGEEHELAYIAMDYLKGENLGNFSRPDTLLPIKEVLVIAEQVAEALDYAHKQNVVHRDIKPANIIYDKTTGSVKVTDFGVACLTDSSKTKTGTVLGSPSYMSPEQVAGKRVDGRADIFSLGVTLYQMMTGHLPFEADSLGSLMYKIANEAHPKPSKFRKGMPTCITRIINKCMQKDPQKRYQSGSELAAVIKRCREK